MTSQSSDSKQQTGSTEVLPAHRDDMVTYVPEYERRGRFSQRMLTLVGTIGVLAAIVFGLKALDILPNWRNPFATQTTDRSGPVLLQSIQDLSHYVAAEGNFQVIVDVEESKRFVPNILFSERTLFVGVGSVDAYVDFAGISEGAITTSADQKTVEIKLPAPVLEKPSINLSESRVFARQEGLFNRVDQFVSGDPNREQQFYQLAEQKIADTAQKSELRQRAEKNTRLMLESLLRSLGYEHITITFAQP